MESEKSDAVKREEEILAFWKENDIFAKSLERGSDSKTFVFYDGPPGANGKPHMGHFETRAFKDVVPRYKTMRGYRVPRRAGWDTHGLPVELEVEKQLGFSGKPDIEKYGIEAFNKKCKESAQSYIHEWEVYSDRMGYWVDYENAYFTFNAPYMESLFNIVKKIDTDGRLYKDYKVLPWCSRCGTALSSHELAQGYEDVKDLSLTAKFELVDEPGTFILAWTTTPWTLPGNIALAVGNDIEYAYVQAEGGVYIVASALVAKHFGADPVLLKTVKGSDLVGKEYTPLYSFIEGLASETEKAKFDKAFHVYPADFVTTTDGTGIVHTAVMYGQDDFELGQKVGLPKVHLVGADGLFIKGTGFLEGRFVREEDANKKPMLAVEIVDDLTARGLFFSKENYQHTYPFCWRCKTPLIYYARDSWFIRMTDLREDLLAANADINWEPSHIRDGRMGEWLSNVKDWAISRERYWGTPLPVWESDDKTERLVIGSVEELKARTKKSGNTYYAMRHGESVNNVKDTLDCTDEDRWPLTERGQEQIRQAAKSLEGKNIDLIFVSPLARTQETASILAEQLSIPAEAVFTDERIREINMGDLCGQTIAEFVEYRTTHAYEEPFPNGESSTEVKKRFGAFLYELETTNQGKNILIVTHGIGLEMFIPIAQGAGAEETRTFVDADLPANGEVREIPFVPLPHNEDYELDLHRPYIDDVVLVSESGKELTRVKEVMDVWFDSGSMPFAQDHYPFENKEWIDTKGFPADYISEAIDQTRGWFYTLLAVGALMGKGRPFKNVICLGHLLDEKGQKMSKSKGNVVEPMQAIEKYGADTLRFWMYSVNQPGDSKSFDEKTVKEAARVLSWFENSVKFYQLFSEGNEDEVGKEQVIDLWMRSRLSETIAKATGALDAYDLYGASRAIAGLVEDLSQWYVRRVRDRVRDGDTAAITTLRDSIETISVLLAPFTPFTAEWAYQIVRDEEDVESVHLADWYEAGTVDDELIAGMTRTRALASEALMLRQKSGVKVSQPLASLSIIEPLPKALGELLCEEVNVEEIISGADALSLDTNLTPELIAKGDERLFTRAVAAARKEEGFLQTDTVTVLEDPKGKHVAELSTGAKRFSLTHNAS